MGLITAGARRGAKKTCPHTHTKKALCAWPRLESARARRIASSRSGQEVTTAAANMRFSRLPLALPSFTPSIHARHARICAWKTLNARRRATSCCLHPYKLSTKPAHDSTIHPQGSRAYADHTHTVRWQEHGRNEACQRQVQPECQPLLHPEDSAPRGSLCNRLC